MSALPVPFYQNPFPAMTAQSSYDTQFSNPWPGTVADNSGAQDFVTGVNETLYIPFGVLVCADEGNLDNGIRLPASEADVQAALGIAVRTGAMESRRDGNPPSYQPGDPTNVMKQGRMWIAPETAVVKGGAVYARITANSPLLQLGAFRADNDGGKAILVPNAKFANSQTSPSQPALIEFNRLGL